MGSERDRLLAEHLLDESERTGRTPEQIMARDRAFWIGWARSPDRDVVPGYISNVVDRWVREEERKPGDAER